jgi:hypothetical protein
MTRRQHWADKSYVFSFHSTIKNEKEKKMKIWMWDEGVGVGVGGNGNRAAC